MGSDKEIQIEYIKYVDIKFSVYMFHYIYYHYIQ